MKTLVIGFSRPKKWNPLSWLIMKIQKTNYSHVYLKFHSSGLDRDIIYQASGLQVNFVGAERFFSNHLEVKEYELQVSDEAYKQAMVFAVDKAGAPYSGKQLFGILIYMATGKIVFKDGRSAYVCSELIGQILTEDLKINVNKDLDLVIPRDINEVLRAKYG